MQIRKSLFPVFIAVLLFYTVNIVSFAGEVPDLSKKGSIHITMHQGENVVPGGTLTLYQAGIVEVQDGNFSFALTDAFSGSTKTLTDIQSAGLAEALAEYAGKQLLEGIKKAIDEEGNVIFTELEPGLYLLVQEEAASGYNKAVPFLVSIPMEENGIYLYDVDASPKVELEKETTPPTEPGTPSEPETPSEPPSEPELPFTPDRPGLPQTGQLNWPIPILSLLGLCSFSIGWVLRFGRKGSYEK